VKQPLYRYFFCGSVCVAAVALSGCALPPRQFRLVDGDTKQPLSRVTTEQVGGGNWNEYFTMWIIDPPVHEVYARTGTDGTIATKPLSAGDQYEFWFRRDGYLTSTAIIAMGGKQIATSTVLPDDNHRTVPTGEGTHKPDEIITVPMYRVGSPSTQP
jgi:hypothetical protein